MNHDRLKAKLLETINDKREEMIEIANREGFTSEIVIKCSQDLDMLLNKYQYLLLNENEKAAGPFYELIRTMESWTIVNSYSS